MNRRGAAVAASPVTRIRPHHAGPKHLLALHEVEKTYWMGHTPVRALRGVSLSIDPGEFVAIMGPSGSGKSTLMHVLGLLDGYDDGRYVLDGEDTRGLGEEDLARLRARAIGFVFQQFNLLPRLDVVSNIGLPLLYGGAKGAPPAELAKLLGLGSRADHRPGELSGGQQQRVAIARSLVNQPRLILADEPTGNLDSKTQREIMDLLVRLNRAGLTIVVVTHEEEVARYARRVIWMRDGVVQSDRRQPGLRQSGAGRLGGGWTPVAAPPIAPPAPRRAATDWRATLRAMRPLLLAGLADLAEAARSLAGNKMRTFLSTLGITIGVAAVIAMLAIGAGAQRSMEQMMTRFGTNLFSVRPNWSRPGGQRGASSAVTRLTIEDAEALRRAHPRIARTAPAFQIGGWGGGGTRVMTANGKNWTVRTLEGVVPDSAIMRNNRPVSGRYVTERDLKERGRVVLLGRTPYRELFPDGSNPIGREIRINKIPFTVIGVLPEKGANAWSDNDDFAQVPISTAMFRLSGDRYVGSIDVEVMPGTNMEEVIEAARQFLLRRYQLAGRREDAFDIRNEMQFREMLSESTNIVRMLISVVAGISLVVGGIGIMNIMLVTVTERTREIGLRKAVGARPRDILWQFLVEATTISVAGGVMGIAIGAGIALLIGALLGWAILITPGSIVLAFGVATGTGILFGFMPARRAAGLHPAVALRSE